MNKMQENSLKMFLFFSELLGRSVVNSEGETLGKVADMKVRLGELFPKVASLCLRKKRQHIPLELDWVEVEELTGHLIQLKPEAEEKIKPLVVNESEILLREELFDKQVVDTFGAKIERVNDIHLLVADGDLRLVHVDIGIRGVFRRLGWIKVIDSLTDFLFSYHVPEKMISWKYVQPLASDPHKKDLKLNVNLRKLHELHPSDLADILEELDQKNRSRIFRSLDLSTAAETLQEVEPKFQRSLVLSASEELVSDILEEMEPDEATDLLAGLPQEKKTKLIQTMEKPSREKLEELLKFEEGTAGSIMTKDYIFIQGNKTIADASEAFKNTTHPLDTISYLYVTDEENHLVGVLTLRHLVLCEKSTPLSKLMNTNLIKVKTEDDVRDVREIFKKYKLLALPVTDDDNRLKGIITLRDIVEAT